MKAILHNYFLPAIVSLISLLAQAGGEKAILLLRYQRDALQSGEVWRLVTGHLVHVNWTHLGMNLAGLWLIWQIFYPVLRQKQWGAVFVASLVAIDVGLYFFHPHLDWYVGLSGILHGLFAAGAVMMIRQRGLRGSLFLLLLVIKLGWEIWQGAMPGSAESIGTAVITDAHLYGAIGGGLLVLFFPLPTADRRPASAD